MFVFVIYIFNFMLNDYNRGGILNCAPKFIDLNNDSVKVTGA
jgi:hypothetical protein